MVEKAVQNKAWTVRAKKAWPDGAKGVYLCALFYPLYFKELNHE